MVLLQQVHLLTTWLCRFSSSFFASATVTTGLDKYKGLHYVHCLGQLSRCKAHYMRAAMHSSVPYGLRTHAVCAEPNWGFDMSCQRMLTLGCAMLFIYVRTHVCV